MVHKSLLHQRGRGSVHCQEVSSGLKKSSPFGAIDQPHTWQGQVRGMLSRFPSSKIASINNVGSEEEPKNLRTHRTAPIEQQSIRIHRTLEQQNIIQNIQNSRTHRTYRTPEHQKIQNTRTYRKLENIEHQNIQNTRTYRTSEHQNTRAYRTYRTLEHIEHQNIQNTRTHRTVEHQNIRTLEHQSIQNIQNTRTYRTLEHIEH